MNASSPLAVLDALLAPLPRVSLGTWPTPLVRLPRLGAALDVDLWMKRDECSGLALGGNKARKLEFVLGHAVAAGARTVVTAGPLTSNHTLMTAAAGRRLGIDVHVVLGGTLPPSATGNLALTQLYGATVHATPMNTAETGGYWIPPGATMPASVPGYAACVREIVAQSGNQWPFDTVVVAYGTGSTSAGLHAGLAAIDAPVVVHAVAVSSRAAMARFDAASPVTLAASAIDHFGEVIDLASARTVCHWDQPADEPGYCLPTAASEAALRRVAQDEGYLLDPTYTAKSAAALFAMVGDRRLARRSRVLFVHTGGLSTTADVASHRGRTT